MAATERALRLTPGIQFRPTDSELVGHYLRKKLCGEKLPPGVIPEIDFYSDQPDRLIAQFHPPNRFSEWYFFTSAARRKHEPRIRGLPREAGPGRWESTQAKSDFDANGFEGTRQRFAFLVKAKGEKEEKPTEWVMDEYTIKNDSSGSAQDPKKWVICKVHSTSKARDREEGAVACYYVRLNRRCFGRKRMA